MISIQAQYVFELKLRLLNLAGQVQNEFTQAGAAMVNKVAKELFATTGEVFSNGQFVRVQ